MSPLNIDDLPSSEIASPSFGQPSLTEDFHRSHSPAIDPDEQSWRPTCLPSQDDSSLSGHLITLCNRISVLKFQHKPPTAQDKESPAKDVLAQYQRDGYALVKHKVATGEVMAALAHGPFVPYPVAHPLHPGMSMSGSDLQVLLPELGVLDLSYSHAWSLGRTLGLADRSFCTALANVSRSYHQASSSRRVHGRSATPSGALLELTVPQMMNTRGACVTEPEPWVATSSSAFACVCSWVRNRLQLQCMDGGVPAHYLLSDPSYLPPETLRFFHVDRNWTDALMGGALSLLAHPCGCAVDGSSVQVTVGGGPPPPACRANIQRAVQAQLSVAREGQPSVPPRYGFMLRSQLLVQCPDAVVRPVYAESSRTAGAGAGTARADGAASSPGGVPVVVQKRCSEDVMYCLFDCRPDDPASIYFTVPSIQRCFVIGGSNGQH